MKATMTFSNPPIPFYPFTLHITNEAQQIAFQHIIQQYLQTWPIALYAGNIKAEMIRGGQWK